MADKGKAITTELEEEEEYFRDLIAHIEAQDKEEENVPLVPSPPPYISLWKGAAKILKDLDTTKSTLQTLLLSDEIRFDDLSLGRIPSIKFKDWDLTDNEKFPQLAEEKLLQQKWLRGVAKVGLLNLRWIPYYHRAAITIFVIRQLICLVHDGYLWLEEPIPITADLVHQISQLPTKGNDPTDITRTSSDVGLAEAMKVKYKLEKQKQGYAIASIKYRGVHVATQLLARKFMRKGRADKVPTSVIALTEQCAKGVQFNWVQFLCDEFLMNCREAQEQGKTFHYA